VRRKVNSLADHLENYGIDNQDRGWDSYWQQVNIPGLKEKCIQLAKQDLDDVNRD